jgi:hypothetical protein
MSQAADKALELIRQHGIYGLGGADGCECTHFHVQHVSVDVSCRKSGRSIRVYSNSMDQDPLSLELIAQEVLDQIIRGQVAFWGIEEAEARESHGYRIRFCDSAIDNANGRWVGEKYVWDHKCAYCSKLRISTTAYLCDDCLNKEISDHEGFPSPRQYYPWPGDGFMPAQQITFQGVNA